MKKIVSLVMMAGCMVIVIMWLSMCASVPVASEPDEEAIRRIAGQIDYYDHLEPEFKDYYNDGNQFQGQCNDYSLMYSLETGAYLVIVNNPDKNGIYKVVSKEPNGSAIIQWFLNNKKTPSGEAESGIYNYIDNNVKKYGIYHPKIGAYRITFVTSNPTVENLARAMKTNHVFNAHPNGSGEWIYVDVTAFDTQNEWRVYKLF
jgi:hypothetical protein